MKKQNVLSILTCYIEILLFSGEIFGFPLLQMILEKEGYFYLWCHNSTMHVTKGLSNDSKTSRKFFRSTCLEQEASFNLVFTFGISSLNLIGFFNGYILDRFGTWIYRILPIIFKCVAYILLMISTPSTSYLLYPFSILNSLSGVSLLVSNFQIANFSKSLRSTLITLMEGTFDSSVVVFFLVKIGYDYGINFQSMLLILLSLTTFLWLRTFLLMPRKHVPYPLPEEGFQYGWKEIKCCNKQADLIAGVRKPLLKFKSNKENLKQLSCSITFNDCLKNSLFWTNVLFFSLSSLRITFFNSSLLYWLKSIAANDVSKLSNVFGVILLFGVFVAPLNGLIVDSANKLLRSTESNDKVLVLKSSLWSLGVTFVLCVMFSIMTVIPSIYGSFGFFLITRSFIYGGNTNFIAANFPSNHFGKLYGLNLLITGLINFLQYAIFKITLSYSFFYVNISLLVMILLTSVHLVAIYIKIRNRNV